MAYSFLAPTAKAFSSLLIKFIYVKSALVQVWLPSTIQWLTSVKDTSVHCQGHYPQSIPVTQHSSWTQGPTTPSSENKFANNYHLEQFKTKTTPIKLADAWVVWVKCKICSKLGLATLKRPWWAYLPAPEPWHHCRSRMVKDRPPLHRLGEISHHHQLKWSQIPSVPRWEEQVAREMVFVRLREWEDYKYKGGCRDASWYSLEPIHLK